MSEENHLLATTGGLSLSRGACLGALALWAASGAAVAQTDAGGSVVVTGSVQAQRSFDAPFSISTVAADELRAAGPLINLSEALARVPGLVVSNRNNYAQDLQISSRGFGARAAFGVRGLRLYADGIPATMPDGQGQVAHFDLANAQRIEVLRGPFSVLYGNSSGGVIALFTEPVRDRRLELALDGGSAGLQQARLRADAPLTTHLGAQLSVADTQVEGFRPQSAAHRTLGNLRLGWDQGPDRVTMVLSSQDQHAQDPLGLTRAQFDADPYQTTAQAAQFDTRKAISQTQAGLHWRHRFEGDGALRETAVMVYQGVRSVTQWQAIAPAVQTPVRHGGGVVDFDRGYGGVDARGTWRLGPIDAIHTRIGAADDLANAQSTFMLEMTEGAQILHSATPHSLVLMDEIGRGTSTFDGLALAGAIASQLHDRNRAFTLFATHYFELTAFPAKHERAVNMHVSAVESGHDIVFLHAIEAGPASRSYGVQVARLAGMPASLVRQARATLEALEAQQRAGDAQVDLFAPPPADLAAAEPSAVERALAAIDPDALTPREALEALYRLKGLAGR